MPPHVVTALVLLAAVATAAPVAMPQDEHAPPGDLGESSGVSATSPPTEEEGMRVMQQGLKLWKQGEKKNGGESLSKLNKAFAKLEAKQFKQSAAQAEHYVEEAVIANHVKHPRQIARDTAKQVERGLSMADRYTGDDIAQFESGVRKAEHRAEKQGGVKTANYGKYVEKEINKGMKMEKKGEALRSRMAHFQQDHPNQFAALKKATTDATSGAPPAEAVAAFKKVIAGTSVEKKTPKSQPKSLALLQLASSKPDKPLSTPQLDQEAAQAAKHARADSKSVGHPNLAKKYAMAVEKAHGYVPTSEKQEASGSQSPVTQPKATTDASNAQAAPKTADAATVQTSTQPQTTTASSTKQAPAAQQTSGAANAQTPTQPQGTAAAQQTPAVKQPSVPTKGADSKSISPFVSEVMKKVDAAVDMQFTPLEEQLGNNLHQEAKIAKNEAKIEKNYASKEKDIVRSEKETGLSSEISIVAKHAEAESKMMKDAVNKAKREHRATQQTGKTEGAPAQNPTSPKTVLLQLGESSPPPATFSLPRAPVVSPRLRPLVNKDAIHIIKEKDHVDSTVLKAMRQAESKMNTELATIEPSTMRPVKKLHDALDRTLTHVTKAAAKHIEKEEQLMESLKVPPITLLQLKPSTPQLGQPMPKTFDPHHKDIPITYKLPATPIGNVKREVQRDVTPAMGSEDLIQTLAKAEVAKVEADDHDVFRGLDPADTYRLTKHIDHKMASIGKAVEKARLQTAARVEEGVLPNGRPVGH